MGARSIIGNFEALLLRGLLHLGEDAYGVPLRRFAEEIKGRPVSIGALYTTLDRLEAKGFVTSRIGEATPERGGRAKKYFKIEGAGMSAYQDWEAAQSRIQAGLGVLQPAGGIA